MEISNRKKLSQNMNLGSIGENEPTDLTIEAHNLLEYEDNDAKKSQEFGNGRSIFDRKKPNFKMSTINSNEPNTTNQNMTTFTTNNLTNTNSPRFLRIFGGDGSSPSRTHNHSTTRRYDPSPTRAPNHHQFNSYRSSIEFYRLKLSRSKLKAVTRTSALLSGFAMVAMVELGLDYRDYFEDIIQAKRRLEPTVDPLLMPKLNQTLHFNNTTNITNMGNETSKPVMEITIDESVRPFLVPQPILIMYALVTCLLVGVHLLALMISTCILPQVEATAFDSFELEQQFYDHKNTILSQSSQMLNTASKTQLAKKPSTVTQNPQSPNLTAGAVPTIHINGDSTVEPSPLTPGKSDHFSFQEQMLVTEILFPYNKFHRFIELAWISSTVIGIFLFLVEIGLVCYIKFYPISVYAAMAGAIVMAPILILFVIFTIMFYQRLADLRLGLTKLFLHQVDRHLHPLNDHIL